MHLLSAVTLALLAAAKPDPTALAAIRPEALHAHVAFLASDALEGRGSGTRGHALAAAYVAAQFEGLGLEPGAPDGSWRQSVPLRRAVPDPAACKVTLVHGAVERPLEQGRDFACFGNPALASGSAMAPVVFVGYGVSAPERGYDDYAGVDVRGKIVALVGGAPASFPSDERAYYGARLAKRQDAVRRGAVSVISLFTPEESRRMPWARVAGYSRHGSTGWLGEDGRAFESSAALQVTVALNPEVAGKLFEGAPRSLADAFASLAAGHPASFETGNQARLESGARLEDFTSDNVVAVLRGSDPKLGTQAVVLSAHLDHLGMEPETSGQKDRINNGAYDNASGVASLIETARAFTRLARRPARSVLFVAVTGEEMGLLGSDYFVRHPPALTLVADVNMDMALTLYPVADVIAFGAEHSSLGEVIAAAAGKVGLALTPDPFPQESIFVRSDHYSFVKQGIPALMLSTGLRSSNPRIDGALATTNWLRSVYHSPADDMQQSFDWESGAKIARANFLAALQIANAATRPNWKPGDFFARKFTK